MKFEVGDRVVLLRVRVDGRTTLSSTLQENSKQIRGRIIEISSAKNERNAWLTVLCDNGKRVHRKFWNMSMEEPLESLAAAFAGLTSGTDAL